MREVETFSISHHVFPKVPKSGFVTLEKQWRVEFVNASNFRSLIHTYQCDIIHELGKQFEWTFWIRLQIEDNYINMDEIKSVNDIRLHTPFTLFLPASQYPKLQFYAFAQQVKLFSSNEACSFDTL